MKIRRLLSLLLAAILCFTVAISLMACEDDPGDEETTPATEDVVDEGGEDDPGDEGGEEAVG